MHIMSLTVLYNCCYHLSYDVVITLISGGVQRCNCISDMEFTIDSAAVIDNLYGKSGSLMTIFILLSLVIT